MYEQEAIPMDEWLADKAALLKKSDNLTDRELSRVYACVVVEYREKIARGRPQFFDTQLEGNAQTPFFYVPFGIIKISQCHPQPDLRGFESMQ